MFKRLFDAFSDDPDMEYARVDATIVKVHRHGQGAKGGTKSQAIGRSKGGMTTKIPTGCTHLWNDTRFSKDILWNQMVRGKPVYLRMDDHNPLKSKHIARSFRRSVHSVAKILALTDTLGNLVRFALLPGQRFDTVGVAPLIRDLDFNALIGDMAFDSNTLIADLDERGAQVVIAQHPHRASPRPIDKEVYKWRHLIENFFGKCSGLQSSAA